MQQMIDKQYNQKIIEAKRKRLGELQIKEASMGIDTPPQILIEIEKLKAEITELEQATGKASEKSTHLLLLQKLLDELPAIKKLNFHHSDCQRWHDTVKLSLRKIFGETSDHIIEYNKIVWRTSNEPKHADAQREVYSTSCAAAEGRLKAAIYDL